MAQGDVKQGKSWVDAGGYIQIKPPAGQEWVIHNIYWSNGTVELCVEDSMGTMRFDQDSTQGARLGMVFHVTNTQWLTITNINTLGFYIAYDGIQTK